MLTLVEEVGQVSYVVDFSVAGEHYRILDVFCERVFCTKSKDEMVPGILWQFGQLRPWCFPSNRCCKFLLSFSFLFLELDASTFMSLFNFVPLDVALKL